MLLDRFVGHDPRLAAADGLAEVARLDFESQEHPALLAYSPVSRGNPFQSLLYGRLPSANIRAVPAFDLSTTVRIADALREGGPAVVAHLHWLNVVMQKAANQTEARTLLDRFVADLARLKDAGAGLLWTVHNVLPHDARFPELEIELRRAVVDQADLIHIMSPRTPELVSEHFVLPAERTFQVPHPRYTGVYPSAMSRTQARSELGLPEHATVFLLFGRIAPYKGVTELVEAFDAFSRQRPGEVALVLAGDPVKGDEMRQLFDAVTAHPSIHGAFRKIPEHQVQVFCKAADVMALPYRRSLNSGALNLALTFGLPVVLPRSSGESEGVDPAWAEVYDDDEPGALVAALAAATARLTTATARAAADHAGLAPAPDETSLTFTRYLRQWLDASALERPITGPDASEIRP
jgi:glycosyltransferase involved in cell wall biosynthesis